MKAYVIMDDDDISNVLVDRKKARNLWVYEVWCYGVLEPGLQELRQALESFHEAEDTGESSMYNGPFLIVKEITT